MQEIDFTKVQAEVDAGYIGVQQHPPAPLRISNYTPRATHEWRWTPETIACRGLIVHDSGRIVARPFPKFFSYEQLNGSLPSGPFEVYEKMDGCLGILYWNADLPFIATRGRFDSPQAIAANRILRRKYSTARFSREHTYLFEIVHPNHPIVVDYRGIEDLFLLAIIETATGRELPLPDPEVWPPCMPPIVEKIYGFQSIDEMRALDHRNREGFVLKYETGERVKIKLGEYQRLHRLLTHANAVTVWEILRSGALVNPLLERVPTDFYMWVDAIINELRFKYNEIELWAKSEFSPKADRKETAAYFQTCKYPAILFMMLDGKDYSDQIWKLIRPSAERTFRSDIDA